MRRTLFVLLALWSGAGCAERGTTAPGGTERLCVGGSVAPDGHIVVAPGTSVVVTLDFRSCAAVTVTAAQDPEYRAGRSVAVDAVLSLSPPTSATYTFTAKGSRSGTVVRTLVVDVVPPPSLSIDASAVPDSGVVLNSTMTLPLNKQYINTCSVISFDGTPATADSKTVKATATLAGDALVYSPGSTMPALVNGKRQATITVSCLGLDNSFVTKSITIKLVVPTLKCGSITPDSVNVAWTGDLFFNCTGNSVTSSNGADFKGTVISLTNTLYVGYPPDNLFITYVGGFQDPNHFWTASGRIGPPATYAYDMWQWIKNSERTEDPLKFALRYRP